MRFPASKQNRITENTRVAACSSGARGRKNANKKCTNRFLDSLPSLAMANDVEQTDQQSNGAWALACSKSETGQKRFMALPYPAIGQKLT